MRQIRGRVATIIPLLALAACGSSAAHTGTTTTQTASPATAHCAPAGARVIAADSRVAVYKQSASVYGCDERTSHRVRLGSASVAIASVRVDHVALAGENVAYGAVQCGVDTCSASVTVVRLSDGKQLRNLPAVTGSVGPEAFQSVDTVVVKRDASVAWVATINSIIGHGTRVEVHANGKLLDSGSGIAASSLKLSGARLTWSHGGATRSATLS